MFAKLFSRITESSIMEEPIEVRYAFVMLLAICDPTGHVIGTDIAIARRINMPVSDFARCAKVLMAPDPHSNSKEMAGRRIVLSEHERGYLVVNYLTYREMKNEEDKRAYMREYMQKRRALQRSKVNSKTGKHLLADVTQAEGEAEGEAEAEEDKKKQRPSGYAVPACFESVEGFSAALAGWIESRKKMRQPATGRAIQIVIDRLAERPQQAIAALNEAIERGWRTVKWEWLENSTNGNKPNRRTESDRDRDRTGIESSAGASLKRITS